MQGWKSHVLVPVWLVVAAGLLLVGCSTKEDPTEVLDLCGNHSCGNLIMVTTDTSSDGFQYLEPVVTDDGSRIYFTADYAALPPVERPPDPMPVNRQIMYIPVQEGRQPLRKLSEAGASVVKYATLNYYAGGPRPEDKLDERQKGSPQIIDDHTLLIWAGLARGARLVKLDFNTGYDYCQPETLYLEPQDYSLTGRMWQHRDPAVSPDRRWVAFTRFGYQLMDSLPTYTRQELWVVSLETGPGAPRPRAFPLTSPVSLLGGPSWSPDGRMIAFHASLELGGETGGRTGTEIFTIAFDTTGLAATGGVPLDRNLHRITYSEVDFGNPLRGIQNLNPTFTGDGSEIVFVSTRRAPSITLYDRNIWRVPSDGRLDPEILFFSRADDVDPSIVPGTSGAMVLSSSLGFPSEMLSRIEQETYQAALELDEDEDGVPDLTEPEALLIAQQKRQELEFFERVMSHLYVFSGWQ